MTKRLCIKYLHSVYTSRGFILDHILSHFEIESAREDPAVVSIKVNTTSASEHVGDVERLVYVLIERLQGLTSILSFIKYPKMTKIGIVHLYLFWLNIFPRKGGISNYVDLSILIDETKTDFNLH